MKVDTDWASRVGRVAESLTKTEEVLVGFISRSPHEAAFMSLRELSGASGVSRPVVIDFYRKLGYRDYRELREALQRFYAQHIDSYRASSVTFRSVSNVAELLAASVDVDSRSLQRMATFLSAEQLEATARRILDAHGVYLFGPGTGYYPAHFLYERLKRYRIHAHLVENDLQHLAEELFPIDERDVLLLFAYLPEGELFVNVMECAARARAHIVLVADQADVKLVPRADTVMIVNRGDINFKNSMAVPMCFANLLTLTVELLGGERIQRDLQLLEETREKYSLTYLRTS